MLKKINKDNFVKEFKTNKVVRYSVMGGFLAIAYLLPNSFFNLIFALVGLGLGYISFNDHVDDSDL